ncbi:hypothetical protein BJ170DRAFT_621281 [Xylariales sp. AK1849]|nr:hypothetical protein BJ170DRAFT_621281 [Xylariales sp. AK1849]
MAAPVIPIPRDMARWLGGRQSFMDYGNVQIAWHTLRLSSTMAIPFRPKPRRSHFKDYIIRLLEYVSQPSGGTRGSEVFRRRRMAKVMMAARTLFLVYFDDLDLTQVISWDALTLARNRASKRTRSWGATPAPIGIAALTLMLDHHATNIDALAAAYREAPYICPSAQRIMRGVDAGHIALRKTYDATWGFRARDGTGTYKRLKAMVPVAEDGNSLWISLQFNLDCSVESLRSWMITKYLVYRYFKDCLYDNTMHRHRLYVHLERQSWNELETRIPDLPRQWGQTGMLRAFQQNRQYSGPPMYGHFRGMMQVISDFFRKEIVLFIRADPAVQIFEGVGDYTVEAYGRRIDGIGRPQIFLVTDHLREHYVPVTHIDNEFLFDPFDSELPFLPPGGLIHFNTNHLNGNDRYGWIGAPWQPPLPLPPGYTPSPIPGTYLYNIYHLSLAGLQSQEFFCFVGLHDVTYPRASGGRYPDNLPDPVADGWVNEVTPAGYPAYAPTFNHMHVISHGVFVDYALPGNPEFWPRWIDTRPYQASEDSALFARQGKSFAPQEGSQP